MENMLGRKTSYIVQLPVYEGPLDLLLSLIERAELDITTVSLALLTDQYLVYIHGLDRARADEISAFLVIAAKLLQIKSEALLPRPPVREHGEEDIGQSLVDQLKMYKRYKEIGQALDERQLAGLRTYLRVAPPPKLEAKLDLSSLTLEALLAAASSVYAKAQMKEPLASVIAAPKITIREKIDLIAKALKQIPHSSFRSLLGEKPTRLEVVVTFLALLELVKRYRVEAHQDALFSDIQIDRLEDWTDDEELELEFE
jgi:segregation and condensation protein A